MILDSSVLIAILRDEPEAPAFAALVEQRSASKISAASYVEVGAVIDRAGDAVASRRVDEILAAAGIDIEPVTEAQARIAREAFRDFGRGSGHAAKLNFGDCFAYALSKATGEPLLFKGTDFTQTDVEPALTHESP